MFLRHRHAKIIVICLLLMGLVCVSALPHGNHPHDDSDPCAEEQAKYDEEYGECLLASAARAAACYAGGPFSPACWIAAIVWADECDEARTASAELRRCREENS